jgi:hypothetical protein
VRNQESIPVRQIHVFFARNQENIPVRQIPVLARNQENIPVRQTHVFSEKSGKYSCLANSCFLGEIRKIFLLGKFLFFSEKSGTIHAVTA